MIGNSFLEYVFIRLSIGSLRLVAPASIAYLIFCAFNPGWFILPIGFGAVVEAGFYLFVYLPRRSRLQAPPTHPPPPLTRDQRRLIFERCILSAGSSGPSYPTGWFFPKGTTPKREDAVDWLLWALFSSSREEIINIQEYQEELDGYISEIERLLGQKLAAGHATNSGLRSMRITLDPVLMLHRPLLWYLIVCLVDTYTSLVLLYLGFEHYTPRESQWRSAFPPRPVLSFVSHSAPEGVVTPYWYLPHRSPSTHPLVFLHGIGIGLYPYLPFFRSIMASSEAGILLPEILPICMHMTPRSVPPRPEMLRSLNIILESLCDKSAAALPASESSPLLSSGNEAQPSTGWHSIVLASHSYGTFIAGWIVRQCVDADLVAKSSPPHDSENHSKALSQKIAHLVLVDPIPILLSHPAVAHNFLYRHPTAVCAHQLGRTPAQPYVHDMASSACGNGNSNATLDVEPNVNLRPPLAKPSRYSSASAWQLWYFASRDADIARTLCRAFFWTEGGIWREEIAEFVGGSRYAGEDGDGNSEHSAALRSSQTSKRRKRGRNMAVVLGGMDQIVPSEAIRRYLTREEIWSESWTGTQLNDVSSRAPGGDADEHRFSNGGLGQLGSRTTGSSVSYNSDDREVDEGALDVLFNPVLDHAVIFDDTRWTKPLLDVICRYMTDV